MICSKNYKTDYILEETAMPDDLVKEVSGVEVFSEVLPKVSYIFIQPVMLRTFNKSKLKIKFKSF